jgi:MATE family multidrug resistance protein
MDTPIGPINPVAGLPARRVDAAGHVAVDQRAVLALALPLMANSAIQLVLNLTDMWFIGRISTQALAGVGAVQWLVFVVILVLGGAGSVVQTIAAQAEGSRRSARASQSAWTALWIILATAPIYIALACSSRLILGPFGFDPHIEELAAQFWFPRVAGGSLGAAVWGMLGFFNGIGRPRFTLLVTGVMAVTNIALNQLFIFGLHGGVAGSGWATNAAQAIGLLVTAVIFLGSEFRRRYKSHLTWRPCWGPLREQARLGLPT